VSFVPHRREKEHIPSKSYQLRNYSASRTEQCNTNSHRFKNIEFVFLFFFSFFSGLFSPHFLCFIWIGFSEKIVSKGIFDKSAKQNKENVNLSRRTWLIYSACRLHYPGLAYDNGKMIEILLNSCSKCDSDMNWLVPCNVFYIMAYMWQHRVLIHVFNV
jgi:hypothetical protein